MHPNRWFDNRQGWQRWTFALALLIPLADMPLLPRIQTRGDAPLLAWGILADMMLVVPLLLALSSRVRNRTQWHLARNATLGAAVVWLLLPQDVLPGLTILRQLSTVFMIGAEAWLTIKAIRLITRLRHTPSISIDAAIQQSMTAVFGEGKLARFMRIEALMWYYAIFSWSRKSPTVSDGEAFSYGKADGSASALLALFIISWMEPPIDHLVIHIWSHTAAWVITALSVYGSLLLIAEYRATRLRPTTLDAETLHIRRGLMISGGDIDLPRNKIARITMHRGTVDRKLPHVAVRAGILAEPNLCIELSEPIMIANVFGRKKQVTQIYLGLDDAQKLIAILHIL